jgi:hypothetical protein
MEMLRIEYLIIIKKKSYFCDNIQAFINLLRVDSRLEVDEKDRTITHKIDNSELRINYEIQAGETLNQKYFHVKLTYTKKKCIEDKIEDLQKFLRTFREVAYKLDIEFHVVWDDLSLFLSQKVYPLINQTENLMRKLIIKFMVTTLGVGWVDEVLPEETKEIVGKKNDRRPEQTNFLYKIDFIDLADFLLKPYPNKSVSELFQRIGRLREGEKMQLNELREYIPRSNWQRYFYDLIQYESEEFEKKWKDLYGIRNKVAHNTTFTLRDYQEAKKSCEALSEKLQEAIEKLEEIDISDKEREEAAESISSNLNSTIGEFLQAWKTLERQLDSILLEFKVPTRDKRTGAILTLYRKVGYLREMNYFEEPFFAMFYRHFDELRQARNYIVHSTEVSFDEDHIKKLIERLTDLTLKLKEYSEERITKESPDRNDLEDKDALSKDDDSNNIQ